jgi:CIC family chloride channel protein
VTWRLDDAIVRAQRERLAALGRRTRENILLAAVTGAVTGAGVAGFDWVARDQLTDRFASAPVWVQIAAPGVGLVLAALVLRYLRGEKPATADEYIKNFHDQSRRLDTRPVPARLLASLLTLGFGGALGYEGPSIYLGAAVGSTLQRRLSRLFSREDAKMLLVCGAAAGVAAIFKAPATGLVFALEVPYQEDFARRMLLPAGISAATSYVVFVSILGTTPLLAVRGTPPFDLRDLGGAALLGICCGLGARFYTKAMVWAKGAAAGLHPLVRAAAAGVGLAAVGTASWLAFGRVLTFGAGYDNLEWAFDPRRAIPLVLLLIVLRALATLLTLGGGGAGGLFIPLVIEGGLVGRVIGGLFRTAATGSNFFPLVGVSAFLGAGYRVPLAGVMFAAEATGRPGFVVPGVVAAVVAQLFMGRASASPYQASARGGHLERRLRMPVTAVLITDVATVPSDTNLEEFVWQHILGNRQKLVPVVDGGTYLGVMRIDEALAVDRDRWPAERVADHLRTDLPTIAPTGDLRDALAAMESADIDVVAVVDDGRFAGVVTTDEIIRLDEIFSQAES